MMAHFRVEQRLSEKRRLSGSGPRFDWVVVDRLKPQDVKTFSTRKEARSAANELNSRERDRREAYSASGPGVRCRVGEAHLRHKLD
jgi:hypothetical protein